MPKCPSSVEEGPQRRKRREQLEGLSKALLQMPSVVGADYKIRMTLDDDNRKRNSNNNNNLNTNSNNNAAKGIPRRPRKLSSEPEEFGGGGDGANRSGRNEANRGRGNRSGGRGRRRGRHANSSARQR